MNLMDAAYRVVHDYPGGAESLGPRINKSPTTLSHEVAKVGAAKFGLETAAEVTELSQDMRILAALALRCGHMTLPLPELAGPNNETCIAELGTILSEVGELVRDTTESLRDGVISDNEMKRIDRECGMLVASIGHFLTVVRQKHAADNPPVRRLEKIA